MSEAKLRCPFLQAAAYMVNTGVFSEVMRVKPDAASAKAVMEQQAVNAKELSECMMEKCALWNGRDQRCGLRNGL